MNVYLNRFLNTPPAELPDRRAVEADPEAIREDLLETFDEEGEVNAAARLAADYLDAGGDPAALGRMLGHALLCEDTAFHMLQNVEAAFNRFEHADDGRIHLIAAARYLAAHTPTRRQREQTFAIASRLHRGERLHER